MITPGRHTVPLKIYVAIILIIAAIFSYVPLSFVPILLVLWYLILWQWRITATINLLTELFTFFAIVLLLSPNVGLFSLPISLPALALVDNGLKDMAASPQFRNTERVRSLTNTAKSLALIVAVVLGVSLLLGSLPLLLAGTVIIGYFAVIGTVIRRRLPLKPVEEKQIHQRMLAGSEGQVHVELDTRSKFGGLLFIESPYEWLKVSPNVLSLREARLVTNISLTPPLAGPSIIKLKGYATDCWGLSQTAFEIEPIRLYVIPRARYAAWLAKKYLAGTRPGVLSIISNIQVLKPAFGLRRGIEYYGSQLYQPGDSLKNIDWKRSLKYNELITKEFTESQGRSAIILINLAVSNAEEADKLAYNIIVTAMSLARENIPAALAAYDHKDVKLTTGLLQPSHLLLKSLLIARELAIFSNPVKYLRPADVIKLKANMSRLRYAENKASKVLLELLEVEYQNLNNGARLNPATKALTEVFGKVDRQSNIVIISQRNHDAEALAFNTFVLARKGNAVITI